MICFLGDSHAVYMLDGAARKKGVDVTRDLEIASVIFVSQDTPTDKQGNRQLEPIRALCSRAIATRKPVVLTSQVPPGFTRSMGIPFHQAETLRIKDAVERAISPEMFIVGSDGGPLPFAYQKYLEAFDCPVLRMSLEEAEFSKIAINTFLASQVDTTNRLAEAAKKVGADWSVIANVLKHDKRIGPHAYLEPGRWQGSPHLLRDAVTLESL